MKAINEFLGFGKTRLQKIINALEINVVKKEEG